jgi:hypothetical protein
VGWERRIWRIWTGMGFSFGLGSLLDCWNGTHFFLLMHNELRVEGCVACVMYCLSCALEACLLVLDGLEMNVDEEDGCAYP